MVLIPDPRPGKCLQHYLRLRPREVADLIGFPPNVEDDPVKVGASWGFTVDGVHCGVWFYRGSATASAYGPKATLEAVFGKGNVS